MKEQKSVRPAFSRLALVALCFVAAIVLLSRCVQKKPAEKDSSLTAKKEQHFAGSGSCKTCHKEIYEQHLASFHHRTSDTATTATIRGNFNDSFNRFYFSQRIYISAEKRDSGLFQVAYADGREKVVRRFDYVVGSGKRGQTFLYWHNNYIFQLPLTYFTATNEWTNSPGYSNKAQFNRPVTVRCLECHSTNFTNITNAKSKADEYSKNGIILGVECEKCHGPGAEHVAFHSQHPDEKSGQNILNPAKFSRQQQLDLCRLCHGGRLTKSQPSFSFTSGDKLSDYFNLDSVNSDIKDIDVHGNQYGLLAASKCFKGSNMTCGSCHNAHKNESKETVLFADKCLTCHTENKVKECAMAHQQSLASLKTNCINCHMPELPSKAIMVLREGESIPTSAYMRTHFVTVYKEASEDVLKHKQKL